jgi:hypothetical protein
MHTTDDYYPHWQAAGDAAIRLGITASEARGRGMTIKQLYTEMRAEDLLLHPDPSRWYDNRLWKYIGGWEAFVSPAKRPDHYKTIEEVEAVVQAAGLVGMREYDLYRRQVDPRLPELVEHYYGRKDWWESRGGFRRLFFGHLIPPPGAEASAPSP